MGRLFPNMDIRKLVCPLDVASILFFAVTGRSGVFRMPWDAGDNTSAGALEKRLGDDTANVVTQNRPRWFAWLKSDKQHEAEHPHRRPLLLTQEVLQITADEEIILRSRHEARSVRARSDGGGRPR